MADDGGRDDNAGTVFPDPFLLSLSVRCDNGGCNHHRPSSRPQGCVLVFSSVLICYIIIIIKTFLAVVKCTSVVFLCVKVVP